MKFFLLLTIFASFTIKAELSVFIPYEVISASEMNSNYLFLKEEALNKGVYLVSPLIEQGDSIDSSWWMFFSSLVTQVDGYSAIISPSSSTIKSEEINSVFSDILAKIISYNKEELITCVAFDPSATAAKCAGQGFVQNINGQDFCMGLNEAECLSLGSTFAYSGITNNCTVPAHLIGFCETHAIYDSGAGECVGMSAGGCYYMTGSLAFLPNVAVACQNIDELKCEGLEGAWKAISQQCFIEGIDASVSDEIASECVSSGGYIAGQMVLCENIQQMCDGYWDGSNCYAMNNIHCSQLQQP